jgi:hypothetical protein
VSPAFLTCFCPLDFHHQVSQMTQEYSFELLLTVSMIQHRVPRRTCFLASAQWQIRRADALPVP